MDASWELGGTEPQGEPREDVALESECTGLTLTLMLKVNHYVILDLGTVTPSE